jgi:hypothetical protein
VTWKYKDGTPVNPASKASPCFPKKLHLESELHIDKSGTFGPEFWEKQKTWRFGLEYAAAEAAVALLLIFLITKDKNNEL